MKGRQPLLNRPIPAATVEKRQIKSTSPDAPEEPVGVDLSPPTPGLDDSPYIRFAIDQLTADEEVLGRGRHGSGDSLASYPVERIVPDEGLGYLSPKKGSDGEEKPVKEPSLHSVETSTPGELVIKRCHMVMY